MAASPPTYLDGLKHVVETWQANGTLAELRGESTPETIAARQGEAT